MLQSQKSVQALATVNAQFGIGEFDFDDAFCLPYGKQGRCAMKRILTEDRRATIKKQWQIERQKQRDDKKAHRELTIPLFQNRIENEEPMISDDVLINAVTSMLEAYTK